MERRPGYWLGGFAAPPGVAPPSQSHAQLRAAAVKMADIASSFAACAKAAADDVGVTTQIASTGLQYNTRLFKGAGWAPPTSWLDLRDP
jgi:hypothetical protein